MAEREDALQVFTCHEEHAQSLVTGLAQEVTEHEQVVYGTRALGRGPAKDDTGETQPRSVAAWAVARGQVRARILGKGSKWRLEAAFSRQR